MRALLHALCATVLLGPACTPGGDPPDAFDAAGATSARPTASTGGAPSGNVGATPPPAPIDTARVGNVEVIAAWAYRRDASADLDGDGAAETVVLTSDVTMRGDQPLWEDGHRWAVFATARDGARTLLYGAFVPNGSVEVAVLEPSGGRARRVRIHETTPQALRVFELEYGGPASVRVVRAEGHDVARWLRIGPATSPRGASTDAR
jgi:hypothetical protein